MFNALRRFMLVLVGLTLPIEYGGVDVSVGILSPVRVVTALLLVFVAIQWALERRPLPANRKNLWVAFFVVAVAVSALHSFLQGTPLSSLGHIVSTWFAVALFYFLLIYTINSRRDLDLLLWGFAFGALFNVATAVLGIGENVTASASEEAIRLTGTGSDPNLLAFNLLIAVPALFAIYITERSILRKGIELTLLSFCFLGIVGSLSRAAWVGLVAMAVFWMFRFRRFETLRYTVPLVVLLGASVFFAPDFVVERFATLTPQGVSEEGSARMRLTILPFVFKAFMGNPLLGLGLVRFHNWVIFEEGARFSVVHNAFLQILADQGLFGLSIFVMIVLYTWFDYTRAGKLGQRFGHLRDNELFNLGVRASFLQIAYFGVMVDGQFQPTMRNKGLWMLFSLSTVVLVLIRARITELTKESAPPAVRKWLPRSAKPVAALAAPAAESPTR